MFILCNNLFTFICNGISRNLHFTLLIKKQGTCVDEVAKICEHMKEPCLPTLAYTEHEVYKTLCEVADCKLLKAIRLCPIQCVQSNYIFVLYLDLSNSSFLLHILLSCINQFQCFSANATATTEDTVSTTPDRKFFINIIFDVVAKFHP